MVQLLFLEGTIGSGKTSSLEYLRRRCSKDGLAVEFVLEPVEDWQNLSTLEGDSTVNLLEAFYGDISKYGFCFQTYAFLSRMKILLETLKRAEEKGTSWVICERSIFTDREIFLECLYEGGSVTGAERAVYHHLWDFWIGLLQPFFEGISVHFLHINCDPETALDHIKTRSRSEEVGVDLDYLRLLEAKHQFLYSNQGGSGNGSGNKGNQRLMGLVQVLAGRNGQVNLHQVDNHEGLVKLYAQLDHLLDGVILQEDTMSSSNSWVVNPRKIWKYWDMFWDTE